MLMCSGQSPVPMLVRPPSVEDVSYDVVAEHEHEQLDESVEQQSVSVHGATTSRFVACYALCYVDSVKCSLRTHLLNVLFN